MNVPIELLTNTPAFQDLAQRTLENMAREASILDFESGEILYEQGMSPIGLFVLQAGRVKFYRQSKGKTQILAVLAPGECFGAESFPDDTPCPWTAEAMVDATTIYIEPNALLKCFQDHADLRVVLLKLVSARLQQFVTLVHNLAFRDVASRLATILMARVEIEGEHTEDGLRIHRFMTQQELAAMVGTAREVIYRTFKKFEHQGLLRLSPTHIYILDQEKLAEIARQEVH